MKLENKNYLELFDNGKLTLTELRNIVEAYTQLQAQIQQKTDKTEKQKQEEPLDAETAKYMSWLKKDGRELANIPSRKITLEMCKYAVTSTGKAFRHVPEKFMTPDFIESMLKRNGASLEYVPQKYLTSDLCKVAMSQNKFSFVHVPLDLQTEDMCIEALHRYAWLIDRVNPDLLTEKVCEAALTGNDGYIPEDRKFDTILAYVPKETRSPELCILALQQAKKDDLAGLNIQRAMRYVPNEFKKNDNCLLPRDAMEEAWEAMQESSSPRP